jgi:hypothetical protein
MEQFGGDLWELRDGHLVAHNAGVEAYLAVAKAGEF